jgi:hypothetical protein
MTAGRRGLDEAKSPGGALMLGAEASLQLEVLVSERHQDPPSSFRSWIAAESIGQAPAFTSTR